MATKSGKRGNTTARRVGYELIPRDHVHGFPIYQILDELVAEHHDHLKPAKIALAWALAWQPDADGRVKLGACMKASDLARELAPWDFVILIRRAFWKDEKVTDEHRRRLLDHELCHAARALTKSGDDAVDERGRPVWRMRRHDVEEFHEIVERYGLTASRDLELLADALRKQGVGPFVHCDKCALRPGWITVESKDAAPRVERCECWKAWTERRNDYKVDQRASA